MPDTPDMKAALEIASEFITLADEGKLIVRQYDNTPVGKRRHKDAAQLARAFLALHAERDRLKQPLGEEELHKIGIGAQQYPVMDEYVICQLSQEIRRLRALLEEREQWEYSVKTRTSRIEAHDNKDAQFIVKVMTERVVEAAVERRRKAGPWEPLPVISEGEK